MGNIIQENQLNLDGFIIAVDTREQRPWRFPAGTITIARGLEAGDYSVLGFADRVAIERKSLIDLFGTCGKGRERFVCELERLALLENACIVIEATWQEIAGGHMRSQMKPQAVIASLIAWEQRYGIPVHAAGSSTMAARFAFRWLERFWRDRTGGPRHEA